MRNFIEGPCGLIIGAVGPDGLPHAGTRGGCEYRRMGRRYG